MKIQPHLKYGRFYNHSKDSIVKRLNGLIKVLLRIAKNRFSSNAKEFKIPSNWVVKQKPLVSSMSPIITWIGHSTFLIQVGGVNILTDPVFGNISRFIPRFTTPPILLEQLPKIDLILISHNHKDHLEKRSILFLKKHNPTILVPTGTKRWFKWHGLKNVIAMNWWNSETFSFGNTDKSLKLSFLPASHWTGRSLFDLNKSLWGSWMIEHKGFKIYFAGDTAYSEHFKKINKHCAPIHIALMPIGPEKPRPLMDDAHTNSDQAIQGFLDLNAEKFIPMHWGTFGFGTDHFDDPIKELNKLWTNSTDRLQKKELIVLKFGETKNFD